MFNRTFLFASSVVIAAASTVPALAQTPPVSPPTTAAPAASSGAITVGAQVFDAQGSPVGTVQSLQDGNVVLKTDRYQAAFPATSFTKTAKGYLFGMTQAQVNTAVEQAQAQAAQTMVVGATIRDTAGGTVGTIEALDDQFVTVKLTNTSVRLPRNAVAATPEGPVVATTAAELEAQAGAAATPQPSGQ